MTQSSNGPRDTASAGSDSTASVAPARTSAVSPAQAPARRTVPPWVGFLKMAVFDIGGPLVVYQLAHRSGMDQVTSLVLSGIPPLIGVILEFALKRRVEALGVFVIAGIAVGALLAMLTDDPRLYLLEGAAKTAAMALVILGSAFFSKPALFLFWQGSLGGPDTARGQWLRDQNQNAPGMRRLLKQGTIAFGLMLLVTAAVSAAVAWKASVETSLLWNRIDFIPGAIVFTAAWMWLIMRAQKRGEVDFESMPGSKDEARAEARATAPDTGRVDVSDPAAHPAGRSGRVDLGKDSTHREPTR